MDKSGETIFNQEMTWTWPMVAEIEPRLLTVKHLGVSVLEALALELDFTFKNR